MQERVPQVHAQVELFGDEIALAAPASHNPTFVRVPESAVVQCCAGPHVPVTGFANEQVPELLPPFCPSQRHLYSVDVSAIAPSFDAPAEQALRVELLHTPFTGLGGFASEQIPESLPPFCPSQRHLYSVDVSAIAPSFGLPAEQALRVELLHTPFTGVGGLANEQVPEFAPPFSPSQRHLYSEDVSAIAPSFGLPAEQALRAELSHTPATDGGGLATEQMPELLP